MANLSNEERIQEALIDWHLAGGSCEGLIEQVEMFVAGLEELETFEDGGERAEQLGQLRARLRRAMGAAARVDNQGGMPSRPPRRQEDIARAQALIELSEHRAPVVRSSVPLDVTVWRDDEVREGFVPSALLDLPRQPVTVLDERDLPKTKVGRSGQILRLLFDRRGRPVYASIPE